MTNFIFNEGAALAATAGLDWVNDVHIAMVYETPLVPEKSMVWADVQTFVMGQELMVNPSITTSGACAGEALTFTDVVTSQDQVLAGLLIVRSSDNALVAHIDEGFDTLPNGSMSSLVSLLNVGTQSTTYTFDLVPGSNNENAWFRL